MIFEFKAWPKISRWNTTDWYITEKIDGTNACVIVDDVGNVGAQSRTRIITSEDDNFGFAGWVGKNADDLRKLGYGYHYGEWWGQGIQRNYGLQEKRFSLFSWWLNDIPDCCHRVPFFSGTIDDALEELKQGSKAAPFNNPEGLIITHKHYKTMFKIILGEK